MYWFNYVKMFSYIYLLLLGKRGYFYWNIIQNNIVGEF
jgi:hypothetical protein